MTNQMSIWKFLRKLDRNNIPDKQNFVVIIKARYFVVSNLRLGYNADGTEDYEHISLNIPMQHHRAAEKWCVEQFTYKHFAMFNDHWIFTKENDAILFKLTWVC